MTFVIIRDPLWNNIRIGPFARRIVDTAAFQRLRYVRQLGLAHLVYPGATHSRFEHALGTYHLARLTLALLGEQGDLPRDSEDDRALIRTAALLHDVGHYPFSHAVEEIGVPHHEDIARPLITEGEIAHLVADELGADGPHQVHDLICGVSRHPLQRLISGSLDLDKIEYLKRDALMCGVPYGEIDVDRLIHSLVIVADPDTGLPVTGLREKGLSALESLLFAKYQMYRNVYWHHAVRSATAMYKRLVDDALHAGAISIESLGRFTDEGLLEEIGRRAPSPLLDALRYRHLYKRVLQVSAAELQPGDAEWIADRRDLAVAVEDALALELGCAPGALLLDYPAKTQMLGLDVPVLRRTGRVERVSSEGLDGAINLPALSDQLYRSARSLRVFVAERREVPRERLLDLLCAHPDDVADRLQRGGSLLA